MNYYIKAFIYSDVVLYHIDSWGNLVELIMFLYVPIHATKKLYICHLPEY